MNQKNLAWCHPPRTKEDEVSVHSREEEELRREKNAQDEREEKELRRELDNAKEREEKELRRDRDREKHEQELQRMREDEIQRIAAEAARRVLGKNLTAIDGGAPPSPLPSDSETDIPEKLEPFQGGAKYARWYRQIVCTLGVHMSEKLNDMLAKGSFEPNCGANLSDRQLKRRQKQDQKLYGIHLGSLNSAKVAQQHEFEAGSLFTKIDNNRGAIKSSGLVAFVYLRRLANGNTGNETTSAMQ